MVIGSELNRVAIRTVAHSVGTPLLHTSLIRHYVLRLGLRKEPPCKPDYGVTHSYTVGIHILPISPATWYVGGRGRGTPIPARSLVSVGPTSSPKKSKEYSNSEIRRHTGTGVVTSTVSKLSTNRSLETGVLFVPRRPTGGGVLHTTGVAPHLSCKFHTYLAPYSPRSGGSAGYTTVTRTAPQTPKAPCPGKSLALGRKKSPLKPNAKSSHIHKQTLHSRFGPGIKKRPSYKGMSRKLVIAFVVATFQELVYHAIVPHVREGA